VKEKIYRENRLVLIKLGVLLLATLLFASSCGSSDSESNSDDLLSSQLAETQEQIEELQQTIQDLQETAVTQPLEEDSSQEEISQEEQTEDSEESEESEVDDVMQEELILLGSYSWFENSEAVEELQEVLGVEADGWYGAVTREAHLLALEEKGFPVDGVPEEEPVPCPPQEAVPNWDLLEAIPMASIVLDMDGDHNAEVGQTYYDHDLETYYAVVSGAEFGTRWVELDYIGASPNHWKASASSDINNDNRSEFWVREEPWNAYSNGYQILIFEECELRIARIPDSNDLFVEDWGEGLPDWSWRIACELEDGEPVIVQYVITTVEGEGSITGMVYQLTSTGFTFVTSRNLETFEDPGGPYGTECARTYHDLPSWIEP
tara:strand:- start:2194 stop:3324 length:1131 start_codon:yes stop_codon:yes gene_type:complete